MLHNEAGLKAEDGVTIFPTAFQKNDLLALGTLYPKLPALQAAIAPFKQGEGGIGRY